MRMLTYIRFTLIALLTALPALMLPWQAQAVGIKKVVAVQSFEDKKGQSQWNTGRHQDLGDAMADQLTDALIQSGQFVVLERLGLDAIMEEQDMASSGRFQKSQSARTGKLTSAQILIQGVISEFESSANTGGSSFNIAGIRLGQQSQQVHLGLIIRLIDTTTGQVVDSQRVEGTAEQSGTNLGLSVGGFGADSNSSSATPIGKAVQMAIDQAVEYIAERLRDVPYTGRVIKVKGNVLYISGGKNHGISSGDRFTVHSTGEELIDPATGELLGSEEELIGRAEVFSVHSKYSKAKMSGDAPANVGDVVRADGI